MKNDILFDQKMVKNYPFVVEKYFTRNSMEEEFSFDDKKAKVSSKLVLK